MLLVDTCVLIDVADDDPKFGRGSAECLAAQLEEGLAVSPISYVELAPVFDGSTRVLDEFLTGLGVRCEIFDEADRRAAFAAWARHISHKRAGTTPRRPVADILIGATALRCGGLVTRNASDFAALYPGLRLIEPTAAG